VSRDNADIVRASFDAHLSQDSRAAAESLAEELVFTSPQDDRIDRATFVERCFPTTARLRSRRLVHVVEAGVDGVFVTDGYEPTTGTRHRDVEDHTVRDGRIIEIQVFLGGGSLPI
jgi:ketosteroid isomerase-like protein